MRVCWTEAKYLRDCPFTSNSDVDAIKQRNTISTSHDDRCQHTLLLSTSSLYCTTGLEFPSIMDSQHTATLPAASTQSGDEKPQSLFDRLPPHVQLQIFSQFDPRYKREDRQALARCLRVFKPLTDVIAKRLYQYLALNWLYSKPNYSTDMAGIPIEVQRLLLGFEDSEGCGPRADWTANLSFCRQLVVGPHENGFRSVYRCAGDEFDRLASLSNVEMVHIIVDKPRGPPFTDEDVDCEIHRDNFDEDNNPCELCELVSAVCPRILLVDLEEQDLGRLSWLIKHDVTTLSSRRMKRGDGSSSDEAEEASLGDNGSEDMGWGGEDTTTSSLQKPRGTGSVDTRIWDGDSIPEGCTSIYFLAAAETRVQGQEGDPHNNKEAICNFCNFS